LALRYYEDVGDAIRGRRIVVEARKIDKPRFFSSRTARHGGQRTTATDGEAWIDRPYLRGPRL